MTGRRPSLSLGEKEQSVQDLMFPNYFKAGGNNARLYRFTPKMQADIAADRVAQVKETDERMGPDRGNLTYGYVAKPAA